MKGLQQSEFDDLPRDEWMVGVYRELEWIRIERKYKPGWTYWVYKEAFNAKPEKWMEGLEPREPSKELLLWLARRNAEWKRGKDRERANGSGGAGTLERGSDEAAAVKPRGAWTDV